LAEAIFKIKVYTVPT